MKIGVFGATGRTGIEIVKLALSQGHQVLAFVRDPSRLSIKDKSLKVTVGDVLNPDDVTKALKNQDAAVCALGAGDDLKKTNIRSQGTSNIINGMKTNQVKRLLVISAMGVGNSWVALSVMNKLLFAVLLKNSRADHESQEAFVKESGLDWTIIRPSGLTDTAGNGIYKVGESVSATTSRIARADVADLILKEINEGKYIGKAVTITN